MLCYRSDIPWVGSGQSAVSRSPMSSTKIGGVSLTGIISDPEHPASLPKWLAAQFARLDHRRLSYSWSPKRRSAGRDRHLRVRSTAGLMFRENYSFLTLHPMLRLV
jgi:hypothetical protein